MTRILAPLFILFFSCLALAQDNFELPAIDGEPTPEVVVKAPKAKEKTGPLFQHNIYGIQLLQWDEEIRYLISGATVKSGANFNALAFSVQREINYKDFGWSYGGLLGQGKSQGSREDYEASNIPYVFYAGQLRVFHRLNNRISLGGTLLVFGRTVSWPVANGISAESGRAFNLTSLLDVNMRLGRRWDFYQALGPTQEGSSLWRLGVNYRY